ncbi:MAG: hypothetical protein ABSG53_08150 [Thermoguttaceae bacterium]
MAELLQMEITNMSQPHYAEGWTPVEMLSKQPGKFGKLLFALRDGTPELAVNNCCHSRKPPARRHASEPEFNYKEGKTGK